MKSGLAYRSLRKVARIHDPRNGFALTDIESEIRFDPLTGESSRICHFAYPRRELPDLAPLIEASKTHCPFCPERVESVTPRYPETLLAGGRMRRGEALLVPNLFPYDDLSAIVAMSRAHFLPMDGVPASVLADALKLARDFLRAGLAQMGDRPAYGLVTWNYMPPSGASQVHPHLQVVLTDTPGNQLVRELRAETAYLRKQKRPYAEALLASERGGERWIAEAGGVAWMTQYCALGMLGDVQAVFAERSNVIEAGDAELDAFALMLVRLLAAYARLGLWSFNLTLMADDVHDQSGRHRLTARLLPRFYLHPQLHNSDASYLQLLLGEKFTMIHPERHAAELREQLGAA